MSRQFNYRDLPGLAAYIGRIGAEQRHFRRYVIREQDRDLYHHDKYVITIAKDGEIDVREARGGKIPDEKLPTETEQAAIKADCASAKWPQWVPTTEGKLLDLHTMLRKKHRREPTLFVFRNAKGGIPFVQQRIIKEDGNKADLPWSWWDDGEWKCMEPDCLLPLYGLDRLKHAPEVFLHEGAKTAKHVQAMVDSLDKSMRTKAERAAIAGCPWAQRFKYGAHLGWPGGAPNPHRVDWGPIAALSPHVSVVLVCDNDPAGENAAPYISRTLKRRLGVVRFGDAFPRKFDLADPFPEALFREKKGRKIYVGPSLEDCTEPATWATSGKDRLRPEFVDEWHFTVKPAVFVNRSNLQRRYDEAEFNINIAPFSDTPNVAALLRKYPSARAETLIYEPGQLPGRISFDRAQVVNIYQPSPIVPREGDVTMFEEYLEYLIPDADDREQVKRWIATLIARPDIRMSYGVLLISHTQGVGKTTLAEKILVPLVGLANCSFPTPKMAVDSQFTSWLAFRRLAVIGEIYDGHTAKAYNQLKSVITDANVMVNEKYEKAFSITNHIHVVASSNSFRALKVDDQDRRWLIPGVTEEPRDHSYWTGLYGWLQSDEALPAIAAWAHAYVREKGPVPTGLHAPMSSAKTRTIEEGRSDGERMIWEFGQDLIEIGREVVVRLDEFWAWLALEKAALNSREYGNEGTLKLETPERIASIFRSSKLVLPRQQFKADGQRFRVAANFEIGPGAKWDDLRDRYRKPADALKKPEWF
ncbi:MAG: DUF5906 domain-containing protein [Pseudolabrys sp.]